MEQEKRRRTIDRVPFGLIALGAIMAGVLAACGTSNNAASSTTTTGATTSGTMAEAVVSATHNANFGTILVSNGRSLYTLVPSSTPCTSACTTIWPELVLPSGMRMPTAGSGVSASSLGTVDRGHGVLQVTFGGQPLYFFSQDTASGQVNGNTTDAWGKWSVAVVASPAGAAATTTPSSSPPTTAAKAPATTAPVATTAPPATTTTTSGGGVGGGGGF